MSIHEFCAKLNEETAASPVMDALRKIRSLDRDASKAAVNVQWDSWPPIAEVRKAESAA
jgi:hypothetical protein